MLDRQKPELNSFNHLISNESSSRSALLTEVFMAFFRTIYYPKRPPESLFIFSFHRVRANHSSSRPATWRSKYIPFSAFSCCSHGLACPFPFSGMDEYLCMYFIFINNFLFLVILLGRPGRR